LICSDIIPFRDIIQIAVVNLKQPCGRAALAKLRRIKSARLGEFTYEALWCPKHLCIDLLVRSFTVEM
jgi:hypothetical protein